MADQTAASKTKGLVRIGSDKYGCSVDSENTTYVACCVDFNRACYLEVMTNAGTSSKTYAGKSIDQVYKSFKSLRSTLGWVVIITDYVILACRPTDVKSFDYGKSQSAGSIDKDGNRISVYEINIQFVNDKLKMFTISTTSKDDLKTGIDCLDNFYNQDDL